MPLSRRPLLMATESSTKVYPKVVKLDKALKFAEAWVNKMSALATDEWNEPEFEGRPSRLGLGAKVRKHAEMSNSADPVERNLIKKLGVGKSKSTPKSEEQSNPSNKDDLSDEDEDELESRSSVFSKKRAPLTTPYFRAKKKHK